MLLDKGVRDPKIQINNFRDKVHLKSNNAMLDTGKMYEMTELKLLIR